MTVPIYIFEFPARCKDLEATLNFEHNHISAIVIKPKQCEASQLLLSHMVEVSGRTISVTGLRGPFVMRMPKDGTRRSKYKARNA